MEKFMSEALKEARLAADKGEVPIGCVIAQGDTIIGRGHNLVETMKDPTAHAEMQAIRQATEVYGRNRLVGCTMYVTLEPCAMCAGAIVQARLTGLVIGAMDPKAGACGSLFNIVEDARLNHRVRLETGVMEAESAALLKDFFRELRKRNGGNHQ